MDILREKLRAQYGEDPVSMIRDGFSILMHYDMQQGNDNIPLANNGTREEICEAYSQEQIELMLSVISGSQKKTADTMKSLLRRHVKQYVMNPKPARTDNYDNVIVSLWTTQERIVSELIKHPDLIYNPVLLSNIGQYKIIPCIVHFNKQFLANHDFIIREVYGSSRKLKGYYIDVEKFKVSAPTQIEPSDIEYVDTSHYTAVIRGAIVNNDFSSLSL